MGVKKARYRSTATGFALLEFAVIHLCILIIWGKRYRDSY